MPMLWSMNLNLRKKLLVRFELCLLRKTKLTDHRSGHVDVRSGHIRYSCQHPASPDLDQVCRFVESHMSVAIPKDSRSARLTCPQTIISKPDTGLR